MSAIKHTPGPWHVGGAKGLIIYGPDDRAVANATVFHSKHAGLEEWQANARLIAAAPDQNAALLHADGCFNAALAEGWIDALAEGDIDRIRDIWNRRLSAAFELIPAAIAKAEGQS